MSNPRRVIASLERESNQVVTGRLVTVFFSHKHINSVDTFMGMYYDDFVKLEGVGEKTALALVDLQDRIKHRNARHRRTHRSLDARSTSDTDVTSLRKSPLTQKIENLIGVSIAGPTDEIIHKFQFSDLGRFLLITAGWLEARRVSVAERNKIFDVQEQIRGALFRQISGTWYADTTKQLLLTPNRLLRDGGSRFISATAALDINELYFVDVQKDEVLKVDLKFFTLPTDQQLDAALLNRIAEHYRADVCRNTLAMVVGYSMLNRSRAL